ncbi:MAG: GHKL domain-containing protein [Clostridia bacterium]|nr:GHKL domain-containing protein [Clostridia bacterium]
MALIIIKKRIEQGAGLQFKQQVERHYDEVKNIYQTMRGWRHDYHNHIQTMKAHMALKQYSELDQYLGALDVDLEKVDTRIKTGNVMVDAILNSKVSLAESRKIKVNVKAQADKKINVSDVDLCVIIGNLIDNAIDACNEIENPEDRFIRIYIGRLKQQFYISVANSTAEKKRNDTQIFVSRKGGAMHGHGLRRVDTTVKKYDGYINRQNEPGVFATEILLPL